MSLIGPKPEPTMDPLAPTPWQSEGMHGDIVKDANGAELFTVSAENLSTRQDGLLAREIVNLVNFAQIPVPLPDDTPNLRIAYSTKNGEFNGDLDMLAFEIKPDQWLWARSQVEIQNFSHGWRVTSDTRLFNIVTGNRIQP